MKKLPDIKIVIVDYQLSNMFSVKKALDVLGINSKISTDKKTIESADGIILPGVGSFGTAMEHLASLNLIEPLKNSIASGKPYLGICLGLQLLFNHSEEFGAGKGLGLLPGHVRKFDSATSEGEKVIIPHVGWNSLKIEILDRIKESPLEHVSEDDYMYFVHSFYAVPEKSEHVLTKTPYGGIDFCSSVFNNNIFAVQFHPEKSGQIGLGIYAEWILRNFINQ